MALKIPFFDGMALVKPSGEGLTVVSLACSASTKAVVNQVQAEVGLIALTVLTPTYY